MPVYDGPAYPPGQNVLVDITHIIELKDVINMDDQLAHLVDRYRR